ncbi:hypothetical protein POM88_026579 [Heracleum sosnowskyi]|uniref:Extensin n=1 Tax=Heracleum sosnowskyi TaxID=360622 RepID=A0AAD8I743_9APIA|nr:hypothetical protein POM88_026579 [Heracleum sosnowskyi]
MSVNYLHILLILGAVLLTAPSLALRHPNHKPQPEYRPISPDYRAPVQRPPPPEYKLLFHEPPVPFIPQHPETSKKKPLPWNHWPSPASSHPVYPSEAPPSPPPPSPSDRMKPPVSPEAAEHPVYSGNEPPPPACKASTAFVYHYGHPPSDNRQLDLPTLN